MAQGGGRVNQRWNCSLTLLLQTARRINLRRLDGLHAELARFRTQVLRGTGLFALQHQTTLLLQKLSLIEAQSLAFVTILHRHKVLPRRVHETARENEPAREKERQTRERTHVSLTMHGEVLAAGR